MDTCPDGDYSYSYYDGICGTKPVSMANIHTKKEIPKVTVDMGGQILLRGKDFIVYRNTKKNRPSKKRMKGK